MKPKILIIDDEKDNLSSLDRLLRKDFHVFTCENGEAGIETLKKNPDFAVIVSDQRMPKMSGVEFLEKCQEIAPQITRILLTGYADIDSVIEAINRGQVWKFINKPWEPDDLVWTIHKSAERTQMQKNIDAAWVQIQAKDWAKTRLLQILKHEFNTLPQILEAIESFTPNSEAKTFLESLNKRISIIQNDIKELLEEPTVSTNETTHEPVEHWLKNLGVEEKQRNVHNVNIQNIHLKSPVDKITEDSKILLGLIQNNSQKITPQLRLIDWENPRHSSLIVEFQIKSPQAICPSGLEAAAQKTPYPVIWASMLEPFVDMGDFLNHSQGLRVQVATSIRRLLQNGIRVTLSSSTDGTDVILRFLVPAGI